MRRVEGSLGGGVSGLAKGLVGFELSAKLALFLNQVQSSSRSRSETKSDYVTFNTNFLQIIRRVKTTVTINGKSGTMYEEEYVDSVPIRSSESAAQLRRRAENYIRYKGSFY